MTAATTPPAGESNSWVRRLLNVRTAISFIVGLAVLIAVVRAAGQQVLQQRRPDLEGLAERRPVAREHDARRGVRTHQPIQGPKALPWRDPLDGARRRVPGHPFALLRRLADLRPRTPRDGLAGQAQSTTVRGQLVEKGVG